MTLRLTIFAGLFSLVPLWAQQAPVVTPTSPPAVSALAPSTPGAPEEMIDVIKLPDAPLDTMLQLLELWTGRIVLRPAALPTASYSLMMPRPMPKSEAIRAVETLLNYNQIGITPLGDHFLTVVPITNLRTHAPKMLEGSALDLPPSGTIMAKIFQLNFLRASEFVQQLGQFLNPQLGGPVVFDKTNAVLVTDSVATLQRIEQLLNQLDKPVTANLTPKFYPIHYAKASAIVNQLRTMLQGAAQTQLGSATTYSSDDRTNQIILLADPRQHEFFDNLVAKLDIQADPNTRNEVISLKHANAKDVASLLSQLVSGQNKATQQSSQSIRPGQGMTTGANPVGPTVNPQTPQPAPAVSNFTIVANGLADNSEFSALVTILPDERSNSVIISGTVDDIRLIKSLVERVDILLPQVRIEVVIAEVTLNDADATGIDSLGLQFSGDKLVGFAGSGAGFALGGSGDDGFASITRPGVSGSFDLAGIITLGANSTKSNIQILANPTLATTHNKEASIFVGESRPVFGQIQALDTVSTTTGTGTNPSALRSSITQQEAGIELKIKPLIGADGTVQLEISQTFNAFGPDVALGDGLTQPSVNKREAKSFLNVGDKEVVVLGGYQSHSRNRSKSRLGPIPIIGDLLGPRSNTISRTELMVFIRPHVIRTVGETTEDALVKMKTSSDPEAVRRSLDWQTAAPSTGTADLPEKARPSNGPSLKRPK